MFSLTTTSALFKSIASAHTGAPTKRLNTFAVIDLINDLNATNLNRTNQDAEDGFYWTRKGITRENMEVDYGLLALQPLDSTQDSDNNCFQDRYRLHAAFPIECKGCEGNWMSTFQLDVHCNRILADIVDQINKHFGLYTHEGNKVIMPTVYAESINATYETELDSKITFGELTYENRSFGIDKLRVATIEFIFNSRYDPYMTFDYISTPAQRKFGMVKCESCL